MVVSWMSKKRKCAQHSAVFAPIVRLGRLVLTISLYLSLKGKHSECNRPDMADSRNRRPARRLPAPGKHIPTAPAKRPHFIQGNIMIVSRQRIVLAVVAALLIAGGSYSLLATSEGEGAAQAQSAPPAAAVDVAPALGKRIVEWQDYSGRLEAIDRVEIRPLVSGTLTAVHFQDGSLVNKGDPLFTIDPRPYAAEVSRAQAQLAAARARVAFTASELARGKRLLAENAIARRDFES